MRASWLTVVPLCAGVACGGTSKSDDAVTAGAAGKSSAGSSSGGSKTGGAGSGGASSAGAGSGGTAGSGCPAEPPRAGTRCEPTSAGPGFGAFADCSWGDDPRPHCRTTALCVERSWVVSEPAGECADPPLPEACPEAPQPAGTVCAEAGLACWYATGTVCSCSPCAGGSEYPLCQTLDVPEWACTQPAQGCESPLPQAGDSCETPGLQCGLSCELPITCSDGTWQWGQGMCPICAAPDTPIATPSGDRPIAELKLGDLVYSVDGNAIVAVPLARVGSTPVVEHKVVRLVLASGTVLEISPGHPAADGRPLSSLVSGDRLDEQNTVSSSELVPYRHSRTYDILPASSTGTYFAGGALLGSTLAPLAPFP